MKRIISRTTSFFAALCLGLLVSTAAADVPISGLPSATPASTDVFPFVHSGVTSKASLATIFANALPAGSTFLVGNSLIQDETGTGLVLNANASNSVYIQNHNATANFASFSAAGEWVAGYIYAGYGAAGNLYAFDGGTTNFIRIGSSGTTSSFLVMSAASEYLSILNSNGAAYAPVSGGAYTNASDRRWKKDIHPLAPSCDAILALKPVAFKWKSDGHDDIGFIAQDVQKVLPTIVHSSPDGKVKGYLGVEYANITAPLTACLQKQQADIDTLQSEVKALQLRGIIRVTDPRTLPPMPQSTSFVGRLGWLFTGS